MLSLETSTADQDVNTLRSLLRARDAKIEFQQDMLSEKDEALSKLREELDGIHSKHTEEVRRLQLRIQVMEQQQIMMTNQLSTMERDMNDTWTLKQYAGLISDLSSSKKKDDCVRSMEAKLCKALHERQVWSNRMEILQNSCSETVKSFQEECILLSREKQKLEVKFKNHLLEAEEEKRSVELEYEALLRAQHQTITKLQNDFDYLSRYQSSRYISSCSTSTTSLMSPSVSSKSSTAQFGAYQPQRTLVVYPPTYTENDETSKDSKVTLDMTPDNSVEKRTDDCQSRKLPSVQPTYKRDLSTRSAVSFQKRKLHDKPFIGQPSTDKKRISKNSRDCSSNKHSTVGPRWKEVWETETGLEILRNRRPSRPDGVTRSISTESEPIKTAPTKPKRLLLRRWSIAAINGEDEEVISKKDSIASSAAGDVLLRTWTIPQKKTDSREAGNSHEDAKCSESLKSDANTAEKESTVNSAISGEDTEGPGSPKLDDDKRKKKMEADSNIFRNKLKYHKSLRFNGYEMDEEIDQDLAIFRVEPGNPMFNRTSMLGQ